MAKNLKILAGIQDRPCHWWQTAILAESLRDKLPPGFELWITVCKGRLSSPELSHVFLTYPEIRHFRGTDLAAVSVDLAIPTSYSALNRIEALRAVSAFVEDDDLVFLTDSDVFLYGDLNRSIFPTSNALYDNWLVRQRPFFFHDPNPGVDLDSLLHSLQLPPFLPGGVSVFLDAKAVRTEKLIQDCFRFAQVLFLLGRVQGIEYPWIAEMPAYALALHANRIPYAILDCPELTTQNEREVSIPEGTFYHYYHDLRGDGDRPDRSGAFYGDPWYKQAYAEEDWLRTVSGEELRQKQRATPTLHGKYFFELAERAKDRLYGLD